MSRFTPWGSGQHANGRALRHRNDSGCSGAAADNCTDITYACDTLVFSDEEDDSE